MEFEDVLKTIEEFDEGKNQGFFSTLCMENIKKSYHRVMYQIDRMKEDQALEISEVQELADFIVNTYVDIQNALTYRPIKKEYREFVAAFGELIINWNNNTINSDRVTTVVNFSNRFLDIHYMLLDSSKEMRKLNDYFSRMRNWMPTALDIHKTYFDMLVDKNTK